MVPEAPLESTEIEVAPTGEDRYVVDAHRARRQHARDHEGWLPR
jgi:hypothetical protein